MLQASSLNPPPTFLLVFSAQVDAIGDAYMVVSGLSSMHEADPCPALSLVCFGRAALRQAAKVRSPSTGEPLRMRVGGERASEKS